MSSATDLPEGAAPLASDLKFSANEAQLSRAKQWLRDVVKLCIERGGMSAEEIKAECERATLQVIFERTKGNQCRMAAEVGVHRNTMGRRIRELGLEIQRDSRGRLMLTQWIVRPR